MAFTPVVFPTTGTDPKVALVAEVQDVINDALAEVDANVTAGDKKNTFDLTAAASADGLAYTATLVGLTKAEAEDGNRRMFAFQPNVTNTGAVTMQIGGAGTARNVRTQDDLPLVAGQLKAGVRYTLLAEGTRFYVQGKFAETVGDPTPAQIAYAVLNSANADDARRRSQGYVTGQPRTVGGDLGRGADGDHRRHAGTDLSAALARAADHGDGRIFQPLHRAVHPARGWHGGKPL